jgi:hypothetical protein
MIRAKEFIMNINITENYQRLKQEVTTNWQTGAVMVGVAVIVGRIYGRIAALGIVLITASSYQIIGQQIRVISWMNLRKTLIAIVVFGNSYYNIINPKIMSHIAVALLLIDNFQLSSINVDLSTQNKILEKNNDKLTEAHDALKTLEQELQNLLVPASDLQAAKKENAEKAATLAATIPEQIQDIPARLQNVNTLLAQLLNAPEMQELVSFEMNLRSQVSAMLQAFNGVLDEIRPITAKVEDLSSTLASTVSNYQTNVIITGRQIEALQNVLQTVQNYPQRKII